MVEKERVLCGKKRSRHFRDPWRMMTRTLKPYRKQSHVFIEPQPNPVARAYVELPLTCAPEKKDAVLSNKSIEE